MLTELHFESQDDRFIPHEENSINECAFWFNLKHPHMQGLFDGKPTIAAYIKRLESGIYWSNTHNFEGIIENFTSWQPIKRISHVDVNGNFVTYKNCKIDNYHCGVYGVADNIEQIKKHFKSVIENETCCAVISVCEIDKANEPERGGWRWHKWGEYVGTHEITCEYIKDEPIVEKVLCFHLHYIENK
jgi:hypothetical protein